MMRIPIHVHRLVHAPVANVLVALAGVAPATAQEVEQEWFTCSMHWQIRVKGKADCPICGMQAIPFVPRPKPIEIPPGGLRAFCEKYAADAFENLGQGSGFEKLCAVSMQVVLHGERSRPTLRGLLSGDDHDTVSVAAYHLGKLRDFQSVPALRKLLEGPQLVAVPIHSCREHGVQGATQSGSCPTCGEQLRRTIDVPTVQARLSVAATLHQMGNEAGFEDLADQADHGPVRTWAIGALASRDTPAVRALLARIAVDEDDPCRISAIAAELRLGMADRLDVALSVVRGKDPGLRFEVLDALAEARMPDAVETLRSLVADRDIPLAERVPLARALVECGEEKYLGFVIDAYHELSDRHVVYEHLSRVGTERQLPLLERSIEEDATGRPAAVLAALRIFARSAKREDEDRDE